MQMNSIPMTDEYSAQYFHKMGWMWGRLEVMKEEKTWGDLKAKRIEKELREKISKEIEEKRKPYLDLASNKESEDYQFYLGLCNGMNFAKVIVENPK